MKKNSREDVKKWVDEHVAMHNTFIDLCGADYRLVFENGDSYEWRSRDDGYYDHITVIINNEMVNECLYEGTWLPNGSWGNKLIRELA